MTPFSAALWPIAYFCAGVTEIYGSRGPHSFSNFYGEDGTTLLKSPLGSGRPFGFTSSSLSSWHCFSLKYFSSPAIVIILFRYSVWRIKNNWQGKFWRMACHSPNSPKFSHVQYITITFKISLLLILNLKFRLWFLVLIMTFYSCLWYNYNIKFKYLIRCIHACMYVYGCIDRYIYAYLYKLLLCETSTTKICIQFTYMCESTQLLVYHAYL